MRMLILFTFILSSILSGTYAQTPSKRNIVFETNAGADGLRLEIQFTKGKAFKDPTFAIWVEDIDGNYIESLYVTQYLATGIYRHARLAEGRPLSRSGEAKRPSSLPVWLHKRNEGSPLLPTPDRPVPDALTGATPKNNFTLKTVCVENIPSKFRLVFEINQPFDYNQHWTKESYPGEFDYSYSAQPALLYAVEIDTKEKATRYKLTPIGHSHFSGRDGKVYTDLSTITTALQIVKEITVVIK
jgi:hypothetical protein